MLKYIIAGLLVVSAQAQASSHFEKYQELCELQIYDEELAKENLKAIAQLDIDDVTELSAELLNMVNSHLVQHHYTAHSLSLSEIKELFLNGEQHFNDLYIITVKSKMSGRVYIEVVSYPGDNPYGNIFDTSTNEMVGLVEDGSISIVDGDTSVACPWN